MAETNLDSQVSEKMLQEVLGTNFKDWKSIQEKGDSSSNTMFSKNWQADSGGKLVQLDMMTGKLLTRDDRGKKVDYESYNDGERMSAKNSVAMSSLFMMSPFAMLGMGAGFAVLDQVQENQESKDSQRLKQQLKGEGQNNNKGQDGRQQLKGVTKEMIMKSFLLGNDKQFTQNDHLSGTLGIGKDFHQTDQRQINFNQWIKEVEAGKEKKKKTKKKESTAKLERKRQKAKDTSSMDKMMRVGKLVKKKQQVVDQIEAGHENGNTLEEASRLHSQLEVLDRAIIRLAALGM